MSNTVEQNSHPSVFVAPLQINKDMSRATSRASERPQTSQSNWDRAYTPHSNGQMTPPMTPSEASFEHHADFQTYLRAFYPYHPTCDDTTSTVTLPLNVGDIILVHSVHTNGWADGTLLTSGARGWLPTNYCEGYENERIHSLMKALTIFWDLVKGSSVGGLRVFRHADYVRGLIAGVRCLLVRIYFSWLLWSSYNTISSTNDLQDKTGCLNRESNLVQSRDSIRKYRKALLSDLTSFVRIAKGLESLLDNASGNLEVVIDLDEMVMKAFKMVTRAVKFLDIWEELMRSTDTSADNTHNMHVPPTPPADHTEFGLAENKVEIQPAMVGRTSLVITSNAREQSRVQQRYRRSSQTYVRPGSSNSCRQSYRPPSTQANRDSVAHRVSCTIHPGSRNLASEKLGELHNNFLTCLGYFIGLHIQSRSSAEVLLIAKRSVISCRDMLELVGEVWERDWRRSAALQAAREDMYIKITELAEVARDVFKPLRSEEEDEILMPAEGKPLVEAATACVRAAGECVAESRFVIDRIGDFDFEHPSVSVSEIEKDTLAAGDAVSAVEEEQQSVITAPSVTTESVATESVTTERFPIPPEPTMEPPPPPTHLLEQHLPITSEMLAMPASTDLTSDAGLGDQFSNQSTVDQLLPPLISVAHLSLSQGDHCASPQLSTDGGSDGQTLSRGRTDSLDASSGEGSTYIGGIPDSDNGSASTRGTSPDATLVSSLAGTSFCNISTDSQSTLYEEVEDDEAKVLEKTFAHELVYNKEGLITGGTLPALIERLTTHDSTPDATFVSTFYLTFRLFATPVAFAQALIDRFQYVADSPRIAGPVRLRVYNVFKGWLESHWRNDCDNPALDLILPFANRQLQIILPTAGKRLATLATKVTAANGPLVPRLVSSMGKTNTSIAQYIAPDAPIPAPIITKSQLTALKHWKLGGATISILDFDPLELARQFTIKESQIFCSILPEELLATEWMKKSGSMAVNVRAMSRLSTDLTNLVADSILQLEDPKKRAVIIKQWVKIANRFLELANYDSLMAIICALDSSTILRLKRTWELVSTKTKATLDHLKSVVDISRNYTVLRQRLQNHVPPCLPFVGTYLTDLTFVDVGNQTTRQLPGEGVEESKSVINFDKHMKTAKIISELQRFQIPYRFTEIPELQTWMQDQLVRVRTSDECNMTNHYRRSLLLEPREQMHIKQSPVESQSSTSSGKDKFEIFGLGWTHHSKEKISTTPLS